MKRVPLFVLMLFLLIACGPSQPESQPTAVPPTDAPALVPVPTAVDNSFAPAADDSAADDAESGYPLIAVTAVPGEYPIVDIAPPPPPDSYPSPDGYLWVQIPMGKQCAAIVDYANEQDAAAMLIEEGIEVSETRTTDLMVCEACESCPTSTHFMAQILETDAAHAEQLGWAIAP